MTNFWSIFIEFSRFSFVLLAAASDLLFHFLFASTFLFSLHCSLINKLAKSSRCSVHITHVYTCMNVLIWLLLYARSKNVLIIPIRKTYTRLIFQLIQTVKYTSLSKRFVCYFSTSIFNRSFISQTFVRSCFFAPLPFQFLFKNIVLFAAFVLIYNYSWILSLFGQAFLLRLFRVYRLTSDSEDVSHYTRQ